MVPLFRQEYRIARSTLYRSIEDFPNITGKLRLFYDALSLPLNFGVCILALAKKIQQFFLSAIFSHVQCNTTAPLYGANVAVPGVRGFIRASFRKSAAVVIRASFAHTVNTDRLIPQ
jgi:hypothetical protein